MYNTQERNFNLPKIFSIKKIQIWKTFFRVFTLFFTTFFPVVMMQFLIFLNKDYDQRLKSSSLESIGYTLNIVFIIIYYTILFIGLISSKLKEMVNKCKTWEERNEVINSGLYAVFTIIAFLLVIFIIISIVYSEVRAHNLENVSSSIINYMLIMIPVVLFNMVANYYINLLFLINGIKTNNILVSLYFLMIVETMLTWIFLVFVKSTNIVDILMIPTMIISLVKMIIFTILFYWKLTKFKLPNQIIDKKKMFFGSKKYYIDIMKRCKLSIIFSFCLMISIVVQSLFIGFAYTIDNQLGFLYTKDRYYVLLFVKIVVYNILYLIFSLSRALNVSMLEQEDYRDQPLEIRMQKRVFLRKINYCLMTVLMVISIAIFFSLDLITKSLFTGLDWYVETIRDGIFFVGKKYSEIIPFFIKQSFLYGALSFFFVEHSINNRVIFFRTDRVNNKLYSLVILSYAISTSLLTYIFGFVLNRVFVGISGFFVAFGLYGVVSLIFLIFFEHARSYKMFAIQSSLSTGEKKFRFWLIGNHRHYHLNWKKDVYFYTINTLVIVAIFAWIIYKIITLVV